MSGHGGFSAISGGSNNPQPIGLPKVEDLKPAGGNLGALNVEGKREEPAVADTRVDQANRIAAKLDTMLLKAAKKVAKAVDADALKETTAGLPKSTRKAIDKAAAKAETAFMAIGKFSGREIAAALVKDQRGDFAWNERTPVGKAIKAALDSQAKLSELLGKAINALPADASAAVQSALERAMFQNDRRASEIMTLVCEFADKAEKSGADPAAAARLDKTLASLVPAQSIKMHGSEKIAADFRVALAPLAKRIDDLAAIKERQLSDREAIALRRQIDAASNALAKAERDYAAKGTPLDPELFGAARGVISKFKARLADIKREVALGALRNFVLKTFSPPPVPLLQPKFAPLLRMLFPALGAAVNAQRRLREAALAFAENPTAENEEQMELIASDMAGMHSRVKEELDLLAEGVSADEYDLAELSPQDLQILARDLPAADHDRCTLRLLSEFHAALKAYMAAPKPAIATLKIAYGGLKGIETQTAHLVEMRRAMGEHDPSKFLTSKTLEAVFDGKFAVTTLVETRLSGLPDEDADTALDGSNAVSSKALGSGAVNTVYEVGYKDGSTYIFKPEAPGRQALMSLQLSKGAYKDRLLVAQLNMAAQHTADAFGLGDVMTKTSVGAHDGQFGIFMEKAPGVEASAFGKVKHPAPGKLTAAQIRNLDDAQYAKVVGGLMRSANRLEWFDLLTGQGDRHGKNYMVDVSEDGTVSLKGIDNDACFGKFLIGPGLFRLQGKQASDFISMIANAKKVYTPGVGKGRSRLERDPGVRQLGDGSILVDLSKVQSRELIHCLTRATGSHAVRLPDHIDEELYNQLVAMEAGKAREDYIAGLRARLSNGQVEVAIQRLDRAIDHAKALKERHCVVSTADWNKREVQRKVAGTPPPPLPAYTGLNKGCAEFAKQAQNSIHRQRCLFSRDLLRAVAKPGWFEE